MPALPRSLAVAGLAAWLLLGGGCGERAPTVEQVKPRRDLKSLVVLYQNYVSGFGHPPKDLEEFKAYVRTAYADQAAFLPGFDPETSFVSARDQQPWEWSFPKPDAKAPPGSGGLTTLLVYEKNGVDGKRLAALSNMMVMELDEAEFEQYRSPPESK